MPNYTRPNDFSYEDTPEDWLNSALIFARTLSLILPDGQGIVVDLVGDAKSPDDPECKKVLVYKLNNEIHIEGTHNNWKEGDSLSILPEINEN